MLFRSISVFLIFVLVLFASCSQREDETLLRIEREIAVAPEKALAQLQEISTEGMNEYNRQLLALLRIKAADKAYITHTSDSVIVGLIDYFADHQVALRYPEALYYGGRVYDDLGDYPRAIQYFQSSLELLSPDGSVAEQSLRSAVASQTGRLMYHNHMYSHAVPYLREAIEADSILADTVNLAYDHQLLGSIYKSMEEYPAAARELHVSVNISSHLDDTDRAEMEMQLADLYLRTENVDSALSLIRGVPERVSAVSTETAYNFAANIYLAAGICDTAYMYATKLRNASQPGVRVYGLNKLLSDELRPFSPIDSILIYCADHNDAVANLLAVRGNEATLLQNAAYNYSIHDRDRQKAEAREARAYIWVLLFFSALLVTIGVILYLKNREKAQQLKLHRALENIRILKENLNAAQSSEQSMAELTALSSISRSDSVTSLRERLQQELSTLQQNSVDSQHPILEIINSSVYAKLQTVLQEERGISEDSPLWEELEQTISTFSPNFTHHLQLLTGGKLTTNDLHLALLIKCGITPTQLTILLCKAKATISYRREMLCVKAFGQKLPTKVFDALICLL